MAKFDNKFDLKGATKPLYAGVGVTDLAVEAIRDYVTEAQKRLAEVQKNVEKIDFEPKALRDQAVTRVSASVDALAKDAKARRSSIEQRVAGLQTGAVSTVNGAYGNLVSRGESLVTRIRRQQATQTTASSAKTATTKAKTTRTQATNATSSTVNAATETAQETAARKGAPARSSAKATATATKETAANATRATGDAAKKVGD